MTLAGEERPQNQDGRPHAPDEIVGRLRIHDFTRREREDTPAMAAAHFAIHLDFDAMPGQKVGKRRDVREMRKVGKSQWFVGKQACRHERKRRVLGAADLDGAGKGALAPYQDSIHFEVTFDARQAV